MPTATCTPVNAPLDPRVLHEASEVLAHMGLTMTDVWCRMLTIIAEERRLPFEMDKTEKKPNAETRRAIAMMDNDEDVEYARNIGDLLAKLKS